VKLTIHPGGKEWVGATFPLFLGAYMVAAESFTLLYLSQYDENRFRAFEDKVLMINYN
jgi:hypothetical protein